MTQQAPDTAELVDALRSAISGQSLPVHVGHLRLQVEAALGVERTVQLRREIHQAMVAAEEHLPSRLIQVRPLTVTTLSRLASELATSRSWALPTAERATRIWAAALGFEHLAAVEWPNHQPTLRPAASIGSRSIDQTAMPPAQPPAHGQVEWPKRSKRLIKNHPGSSAGEVSLGVGAGYAGMSLRLCASLLLALAVVLVAVLFLLPPTVFFVLALIAFGLALGLTHAAGRGALVAADAGVEFVPYTRFLVSPAPEPSRSCTWQRVEVEVGAISVVSLDGYRVQVSPLGRAFAEAVADRASRK